ncbi:hypothetical protein HDF26_004384 [Pedobacter cryoconitis]|uniref:DUF4303 domain-containing protein n=1 Tax=Pedobacter cryoconitis TaxID=188932 RepID=UPI00160F2398|nr:DUF4303 domain-containing protein [Pedobacter cryoconitis]MBB6273911.1 hypothetical protein [Pedobacter cryoconitis]
MNNWIEFEKKYNFENTVFELTNESFELIAKSEDFKEEVFGAFAFNCGSGDISLSFDTSTGVDLRKQGYYPPDWTNEVMEADIEEIGKLWQDKYEHIQDAFDEIIELNDADFIDEFEAGYLHSLRKVMVRLENSKAFEKISTSKDFWTLVTQVDADTDQEEELLDAVRKNNND